MTVRVACLVPFCGRTSARRWAEWLCGDHYRLVDGDLKRLRIRNRRRWTAIVASDGAPSRRLRCETIERAIWSRMKRQAIERAAGLA